MTAFGIRQHRALSIVLAIGLLLGSVSVSQGDSTVRVSVDSAGTAGNGNSFTPVLSANGQVVAFASAADNLVAGDTNGAFDVFVHNRTTGVTTRVSVDSAGTEGNDHSFKPVFSANGQVVAFESFADNLVTGDTNGVADIFVHDLATGLTTRVSVDSAGRQGNAKSFGPLLSANGRVIVFQSDATNLVAGDTNGVRDVFVHDMKTGTTARASVDSVGMQGNGPSGFPALSAKGRVVAFESFADNLVTEDTNGVADIFVYDLKTGLTTRVSVDSAGRQSTLDSIKPVLSANGQVVAFSVVSRQLGTIADVFVHDLMTGATERVSVDSAGTQGNDSSFGPLLSAKGRIVAFESAATNLVVGDTNGVRDIFVHNRK